MILTMVKHTLSKYPAKAQSFTSIHPKAMLSNRLVLVQQTWKLAIYPLVVGIHRTQVYEGTRNFHSCLNCKFTEKNISGWVKKANAMARLMIGLWQLLYFNLLFQRPSLWLAAKAQSYQLWAIWLC